ncbi:hypothetical protein MKL32_10055 [Acinetobacter sp. AOR34_HL]|uniref:hypothetical protein n=1 Tax=Acinetobacter sp. AOR34_HL TaxID=2919384 RepID=UPI0022EB6774|nr:hypothetical protein [Acinetobacter sp. AOR34_HL]MDA3501919.1 hypothetical protein [Acinetobacter sp. AOR34_HL]
MFDPKSDLIKERVERFIDSYSSFVVCLNDQVNDTLHDLCLEEHAEILQAKLVNDVLVSLIISGLEENRI